MFGRDASTYDDDDAEADEIWASIDERMDSRRKEARERKEKEAMEKFRSENPNVVETFRDLKRDLKDVSYAEWDAICLLYTSPSPRDATLSRMPSSA